MHLSGGVAEGGTRVLAEASVRAMQEPQIVTPEAHFASGWGLGWALHDWGGQRVIGHDGGTLGHNSYFRVLPERGIAVALLTNGGNTAALYRRIFDGVLGPLAGISLPPLAETRDLELDPSRYLGTYERLAARQIVEERDGKLVMTSVERRPLLGEGQQTTVELSPVTESTFSWLVPGTSFRNYLTFLEFGEDGRAGYLHSGGRTAPRVR
jgi:hypothetical protein